MPVCLSVQARCASSNTTTFSIGGEIVDLQGIISKMMNILDEGTSFGVPGVRDFFRSPVPDDLAVSIISCQSFLKNLDQWAVTRKKNSMFFVDLPLRRSLAMFRPAKVFPAPGTPVTKQIAFLFCSFRNINYL